MLKDKDKPKKKERADNVGVKIYYSYEKNGKTVMAKTETTVGKLEKLLKSYNKNGISVIDIKYDNIPENIRK